MGRKRELRDLDHIASVYHMSVETRYEFGDYLEQCKRSGDRGTKNDRGDFTREELHVKAREFLGLDADEHE